MAKDPKVTKVAKKAKTLPSRFWDEPLEHVAPITVRVSSWASLTEALRALHGYVFRGHPDASWKLASTLERDRPRSFFQSDEEKVLREFQRRAHHYVASPPPAAYTLEWMALLRHYGGPTRLLDFTRSPYVAAFFALESANPTKPACIWAVREEAVSKKVAKKLKVAGHDVGADSFRVDDSEHEAAQLMNQEGVQLVAFVEPKRLNERISIQQGLFLVPFNTDPTLYETLLVTLDLVPGGFTPVEIDESKPFGHARSLPLVKIEFPGELRDEALRELHLMNVSAATLYPGLEGFVKSLRTRFSLGY